MSKKSNPSTPGAREPENPGPSHEMPQGAMAMNPDETVVDVPEDTKEEVKTNLSSYLMWDRGGHVSSPEAGCNRERFAIFMEVELDLMLGDGSGYRAVPPHTWNPQIISDYLQEVVKPITHVAVLNHQSDCVIFSGNQMKKEGMSFDAARAACRRLNQIDNWVGKRVPVRAVPTTVADGRRAVAEAEVFIRAQTEKRLAKAKGQPPKKLTTPPPTAPRGRGMTRRADRYYAQKSQKPGKANDDVDALARGAERIRLLEANTPNTPSEYGSAHEEVTEESDSSSDTVWWSDDERKRRHLQLRYRSLPVFNYRGSEPTTKPCSYEGAEKSLATRFLEGTVTHTISWCACLSSEMVRKEGSLAYEDWRTDVNALISGGVDPIRIRDAVMQSLEGDPAKTANVPYDNGKGTLREVLATLDKVHGKSISYRSLNVQTCVASGSTTMRMLPTTIRGWILSSSWWREHHEERFKDGELEASREGGILSWSQRGIPPDDSSPNGEAGQDGCQPACYCLTRGGNWKRGCGEIGRLMGIVLGMLQRIKITTVVMVIGITVMEQAWESPRYRKRQKRQTVTLHSRRMTGKWSSKMPTM